MFKSLLISGQSSRDIFELLVLINSQLLQYTKGKKPDKTVPKALIAKISKTNHMYRLRPNRLFQYKTKNRIIYAYITNLSLNLHCILPIFIPVA